MFPGTRLLVHHISAFFPSHSYLAWKSRAVPKPFCTINAARPEIEATKWSLALHQKLETMDEENCFQGLPQKTNQSSGPAFVSGTYAHNPEMSILEHKIWFPHGDHIISHVFPPHVYDNYDCGKPVLSMDSTSQLPIHTWTIICRPTKKSFAWNHIEGFHFCTKLIHFLQNHGFSAANTHLCVMNCQCNSSISLLLDDFLVVAQNFPCINELHVTWSSKYEVEPIDHLFLYMGCILSYSWGESISILHPSFAIILNNDASSEPPTGRFTFGAKNISLDTQIDQNVIFQATHSSLRKFGTPCWLHEIRLVVLDIRYFFGIAQINW